MILLKMKNAFCKDNELIHFELSISQLSLLKQVHKKIK